MKLFNLKFEQYENKDTMHMGQVWHLLDEYHESS